MTEINKLIKPRSHLCLPIIQITENFLDTSTNILQRNFLLIYLDTGFRRAKPEEQNKALSLIMPVLYTLNSNHQHTILSLYMIAADHIDKDIDFLNENNKTIILNFILYTILYPCHKPNEIDKPIGGLPMDILKVIAKNHNMSADEFALKKIGMINLLKSSSILQQSDYFAHLLAASCDRHPKVSSYAEDCLKNQSNFIINDSNLYNQLYKLFCGEKKGEEIIIPPVDISLRSKILIHFMKSPIAANSVNAITIIFKSFFDSTDTNVRLKYLALGYLQWIIKKASKNVIDTLSPLILQGLIKMKEQTKMENENSTQILSSLYLSIGSLCSRCPYLFSKDLTVLVSLLDSLKEECSDVKHAIQSSIMLFADVYHESDASLLNDISKILLNMIKYNKDPQSRYIAVYFSNRVFPFSNPYSRFINILSIKDGSSQVSTESKKGLKPFIIQNKELVYDDKQKYPSIKEFIDVVNMEYKDSPELFSDDIFCEVLNFCDKILSHDENMAALFEDKDTIILYKSLIEIGFNRTSSFELISIASKNLFHLFQYDYELMTKEYISQTDILLTLLKGGANIQTKKYLSKIISLIYVASHDQFQLQNELQSLLKSVEDWKNKRNESIGSIYLCGFLIAQSSYKGKDIDKNILFNVIESLFRILEDNSVHANVAIASLESFEYIVRYNPLSSILKEKNISRIFEDIRKYLHSTDHTFVESAAYAFASIFLRDRTLITDEDILNIVYETYKIKKEEIHFTIGETLSIIGYGWHAKCCQLSWLSVNDEDENILKKHDINTNENYINDSVMESILNTTLKKYLLSNRYDTRMPSSIWLLTILKNCQSHPILKKLSLDIHKAFVQLLSDNNETIQEVASKGLILLYDQGDTQTKEKLIHNLLSVLQKGISGFKYTEDTEIPSIGDSGKNSDKIMTYKELCEITSDLNKPELMYSLMDISTHHALWNSKKGASFVTTDLLKSNENIKSQFSSIIPKLFRSSYDPNPSISNSMAKIYNALINSRSASEPYFDDIMVDLLENMYNKAWRTREASCNALADLIRGKSFEKIEKYYENLWTKCFKVLDDIKESVRKAAENLCKSLSELTIRFCDPTFTKFEQGKKAIEIALPFLLDQGLGSSVKEVVNISVNLILKISGVASFLLKPHIPKLLDTLLESISTLEPTILNYIEQQASRIGISNDVIDNARVKLAKNSPLNETIQFCIDQIDSHNIKEIAPVLVKSLTQSPGITSRISTAQLIAQLSILKPDECKLVSNRIMLGLKKGLFHKSKEVRSAFSYAMGRWLLVSKKRTISNVVNDLVEKYKSSEPDDDISRKSVGNALYDMAKSSSSLLQPLYSSIIPVLYYAQFDTDPETAKLFKNVWGECGASLSLYIDDLVTLLDNIFTTSQSWNAKQQATHTLSKLFDTLDQYTLFKYVPRILKFLVANLKGRTWKGKEGILTSISNIIINCGSIWNKEEYKANLISEEELVAIMLEECKKKSLEYRKEALIALGSILRTFGENEKFDCYELVKDTLYELSTSKSFGETSDSNIQARETKTSLSIRSNAILALGLSMPNVFETQKKYFTEVLMLLDGESQQTSDFGLKMAILRSLMSLLQKIRQEYNPLDDESFKLVLNILFSNMSNPNFSSVRIQCCSIFEELISKTRHSPIFEKKLKDILFHLNEANEQYESTSHAFIKVLNKLKK